MPFGVKSAILNGKVSYCKCWGNEIGSLEDFLLLDPTPFNKTFAPNLIDLPIVLSCD